MSRRGGRSAVLALLAAGALVGAPAAGADQGVSIDAGRIDLAQELLPGGSYLLPAFRVSNPGSGEASYRLVVSFIEGQRPRRPEEGWFRFAPAGLTLRPGESRLVQVRLTLPTGAVPGDYAALVGARLVTGDGGAQVGATAAARLTFTVAASTLLQAWWLRVKTLWGDGSPWSYLVPALVLAALAARQLRRRVTITVARRV